MDAAVRLELMGCHTKDDRDTASSDQYALLLFPNSFWSDPLPHYLID